MSLLIQPVQSYIQCPVETAGTVAYSNCETAGTVAFSGAETAGTVASSSGGSSSGGFSLVA